MNIARLITYDLRDECRRLGYDARIRVCLDGTAIEAIVAIRANQISSRLYQYSMWVAGNKIHVCGPHIGLGTLDWCICLDEPDAIAKTKGRLVQLASAHV